MMEAKFNGFCYLETLKNKKAIELKNSMGKTLEPIPEPHVKN